MKTAPRMRADYARGARVSDVVGEVRAALAADDPVWITRIDERRLLERAGALDALGAAERAALPLFGLPFAVKDNIDVAGVPTTAACPGFAYTPERSATAVERLERAGAIVVGKTNLDQFATGLVGTRTPYGIPRNPFDPAYIPGGSSSGSAVAVARDLVCFALGTDTAGSGRVPAAFTATVGLKPTHGIVSAAGVVPACRSLDCVSIFAHDVDDALAIFEVAAGPDERDPFSRRRPPQARPPANTFRFGVPLPEQREFFGDREAQASFEATVARLSELGGSAVDFDLTPCRSAAALLYDGPFVAERTAAVGDFIDAHPADVLDITRSIIASGRRFDAVDVFRAQYRIAELRAQVSAMFTDLTALVVPSTPTIYRLDEIAEQPLVYNMRLGTYTNFVNLLDLCALAVPSGWYANGLPIGVTFIGPAFTETVLADCAKRLFPQAAAAAPHQAR